MEPEVIGERYELQEPVGRGGMATIFKAVDLRMGRVVAVKILRDVYSSDPKFVTRFQREARAASALQHPNIVQVFDYGQSGESYYIVMEFVDGMDLRRYLKRSGTLDNDRAVEISHDVALGLGAAHRRGIVHRDVKPQNILLNDDGLVKLTDFGIASMYKDAEAERLTTTGMTLGTVQYYAPEQAQGEIVSPAADVYALGIVMYELLTGRTPFDGDTPVAVAMRHIQELPEPPSVINPAIAPGLERIILRCLEKDPRDRYRDGDALAYALENYARTPGGRVTGTAPGGRAPFAPLGLPSNNPRGTNSGPRGGGAAYGTQAPVAVSGPRRGQGNDIYGYGDDGYDDPTMQGFTEEGSINTRPYGPATGTVPRMTGPGRAEQPDENKRRNGPIAAVIVGSTILLLLLSCFLVLAITNNLPFSAKATPTPTVAIVTVPNFVGKQQADAQAYADSNNLKVTFTTRADKAAKGLVIAQTPPAGQQIAQSQAIQLVVSSGPGTVKVPDFTYGVNPTTSTDACAQLSQINLKCKIVAAVSEVVPSNEVISTTPPPGSDANPGDTITLKVSIGAPTAVPTTAPTATPTVQATNTATPTVIPTCVPTVAPSSTPVPTTGPCK